MAEPSLLYFADLPTDSKLLLLLQQQQSFAREHCISLSHPIMRANIGSESCPIFFYPSVTHRVRRAPPPSSEGGKEVCQYRSESRHFNFFFSISELLPKCSFLCSATQLFWHCYTNCYTKLCHTIFRITLQPFREQSIKPIRKLQFSRYNYPILTKQE